MSRIINALIWNIVLSLICLETLTSMHVFPATANDCLLQTNSFGLVNRHIFRPIGRNFQPLVSLLPALASFFYTCLLVCLWGAALPPFIFYLYRLAAKSWTYLQKLSAVGFKFDKWFQMEFEIKWIFKNLKSEWMFLYILRSMIDFTIIIFTSKCNESVAHLKMNHAII